LGLFKILNFIFRYSPYFQNLGASGNVDFTPTEIVQIWAAEKALFNWDNPYVIFFWCSNFYFFGGFLLARRVALFFSRSPGITIFILDFFFASSFFFFRLTFHFDPGRGAEGRLN
jgi:hypothetical protein